MYSDDPPPRYAQALFGLALAALAGLAWLAVHAWQWVAAWWAHR